MNKFSLYAICLLCFASCEPGVEPSVKSTVAIDSAKRDTIVISSAPIDSVPTPAEADTLVYDHAEVAHVNTGAIKPEDVVAFAQTLKGIPYQYASCSPDAGFDCSGFVYYVFKHFNMEVPRSSRDFTNLGKEVVRQDAKPGDLILFTGTDSSDRTVGHMGIIVTNTADSLMFIHSSSGQANGVTMTPLNKYYQGRFMKIIRVFKQNEGGLTSG
jgi:cell wall-associated NlpC family hydrolase